MNLLTELDQLTLNSADKSQLMAWVQTLVTQSHETAVQLQTKDAQLQAKDAEIKRKDVKIDALTFELARLRRIEFGAKNEALSPLQRDLFAETLAADIAAVEVELEQLAEAEPCATVAKPKRPRAGRKMLLHFLHSPHPCGLSSALTRASASY
jgi:hypothetical protein